MDITVKSITGRSYSLQVEEEMRLSSLVTEVSQLSGISPDQLQLFSNSCRLKESATLTFSPGDEIQICSKINAGVLIYVKTFQGNTLTFEVDLYFDTIAVVKNKIEEKVCVLSRDQMMLVFDGKELSDEKTLTSYEIKREDTLHLLPKGSKIASNEPSSPKNETESKCCCSIL